MHCSKVEMLADPFEDRIHKGIRTLGRGSGQGPTFDGLMHMLLVAALGQSCCQLLNVCEEQRRLSEKAFGSLQTKGTHVKLHGVHGVLGG